MLETSQMPSSEAGNAAARSSKSTPPPAKAARKRRPMRNKRRSQIVSSSKSASTLANVASNSQQPAISEDRLFAELVRRASAGNQLCIARLREILDAKPEIWQRAGDLSLMAQRSWIDLICAGNAFAAESIKRMVRQIKNDLIGKTPTPIERLLIDLIGVTWLAAFQGEATAAETGGSAQQATLRLRRAESAQRRFLRAIKTLTTLRALLRQRAD